MANYGEWLFYRGPFKQGAWTYLYCTNENQIRSRSRYCKAYLGQSFRRESALNGVKYSAPSLNCQRLSVYQGKFDVNRSFGI